MEEHIYKDYPSSIKNNDFKQISSNIRKRVYKCLGVGSGRIVFDLENGYVVKAAKNVRGIAQNIEEYKISLDNDTGLLAKAFLLSPDSSLLIMEKANRIKSISSVWNYFKVRSNKELYRLQLIKDFCKKYNLEILDFCTSANWGEKNGIPVIIDYGFTKKVSRKYYSTLAARLMNRFRN